MGMKDLAERVVATFVQAAIATLGTNSIMDLGVDEGKMIIAAGVAAALAVVKGWAASKIGDSSPSFVSKD